MFNILVLGDVMLFSIKLYMIDFYMNNSALYWGKFVQEVWSQFKSVVKNVSHVN